MGYVIAAYGVTLAVVGLYLGHLVRERRRLARELAEPQGGALREAG
jgi:heme exporter protein CcmD